MLPTAVLPDGTVLRESGTRLALLAYTRVAGKGEIDLDRYRAVQAWLTRVTALPGIKATPPAGA